MINENTSSPSLAVLKAFGCKHNPVKITGGQNHNFRSGDIVLKPAVDNEETNWIAEFYLNTVIPGVKLPVPVRCMNGEFIFNGWQAWEYIDGEHNFKDWNKIIEVCLRFHDGIKHVSKPEYFPKREQNPWVVADKAVWDGLEMNFHPILKPHIEKLESLLKPVSDEPQLIHGDFGGNVLFSANSNPAVIDFSPYWRPAQFAIGVIIADAFVWNNAGRDIFKIFPSESLLQYIIRAELRRVIELDRLYYMYGVNKLSEINLHTKLINLLTKIS